MTEFKPVDTTTSSTMFNDQGEPERKTTLQPTSVAGEPIPAPATSILSTIVQWLFILGLIVGIYFLGKVISIKLPSINLQPYQIVILAFSFAFTWVYIFKWGSVKPFSCCTCLSGWFALLIGYWSEGWWGVIYMPIAMTFAAIYSEIRMRWL